MVAASNQRDNRWCAFVPVGDIFVVFAMQEDRSIEVGGLFYRVDTQFGLQQIEELLVLGKGSIAAPRHRVEPHQLLVGLFGKRIDGEKPLGVLDSETVFTASQVDLNQCSECLKGFFSRVFLVSHQPHFKLCAAAQEEPGQQIAFVEPDGFAELKWVGTRFSESAANPFSELGNVDPALQIGVQPNLVLMGRMNCTVSSGCSAPLWRSL